MRYVYVMLGMLALVGCAEVKVRPERVAAVAAKPEGLRPNSALRGAVIVGDVACNPSESFWGVAAFDNNVLRMALATSIENAGLKGEGRSPYKLNARLLKVDQPVFGLNAEVTVAMEYDLVETETGVSIYNRTVSTTHEASFNDEADGAARLRLANEMAARKNIEAVVADLQAYEKK